MLRQLLIVALVLAVYKASAAPTAEGTTQNQHLLSLERQVFQKEYSSCLTKTSNDAFCIPYFACKVYEYENGDSVRSCPSLVYVCCQLSNIDVEAAANYALFLRALGQ